MAKLDAIGPGEASVNARTLDDRTWIVAYSAAEAPATYYRYDRADGGGELTELFSSRPALDGKPLVPMWPPEIKSRDGLKSGRASCRERVCQEGEITGGAG